MFALDSVIKRIESYQGVRKTDVFIPISIEYHKEVIIKEIERRLVEKREGSLKMTTIMPLKKQRMGAL